MGLIAPGRPSGRITWAGEAHSPPTRRAIVFQRPIMLRRSAAANVRYALAAAGVERARRAARTAELLALVGLGHAALRPARRLSGGEQQRLALARALARDPDVLFLDEPTASLDPASTKAMEDLIRTVSQRGIKVVMSTHDLGEARRLAGEVVLLHRGRLVESRSRARLLRHAAHRRGAQVHRRGVAGMMIRPPAARLFAACSRFVRAAAGAGKIDRRGVDDLDAGLRPVRLPAAAVQGEDRHRGEGGGARHRPGARRRPPRRCRRGVRACQVGGGQVRGRGRRREALSGDVQRLRADRPAQRSGRDQGQHRHRRRAARRSRTSRRRSSRAATARARTSPSSSSGRRPASNPKGEWYKAIGQGMGAALNTAQAADAYVLADRGTWLAFKNKGDLAILVQGDKRLFNQYGVILVNPAKHPAREEGVGPGVHRLAGLARGPARYRRLQGRRRAAVLSQCRRSERVTTAAM